MAQNMRGKIIEAGYPWRLRITFSNSLVIGEAATYSMHVRAKAEDVNPIVELTTANGGLVRIDDTTLDIKIPATQASLWPVGKTVVMDLVRTDGGSPEHTGLQLQVPVRNPVTRL
ncbi:hypothetical protein [Mesorhizobium sp. M7A.F.Ca.MR.362.00.0.0]|uniref:hypothetical protein n=1 Tax=Mesorhizobium sp. M7A.F.Ca.MR.362.00.0.0 TaxID=2496779 RepID=UPI000FD1B9C1|nr:hypothetical protein [Mesorhizobium sp. M7A.F.Ca.MR.362.00.0.0]RUU72132.1 hypothetical protein EOC06_38435 [Mesorhizobium sp. M7A.F.Ca.MR.362.00.0.0]RWN95436.1 MAG: hypothetical protein EOS05_11625 [Mesorhizobium sp.]